MPSLTMQEAAERSALVSVTAYELDVDLTGGDTTFRGTTLIRFAAAEPGAETFVELRPETLHRATLNGEALDPTALREGRLRLPRLRAENQLEVVADYRYSHASEGMHRFVDPADDEVYVYAQPSITQAPAFMACFDQPDLKATVTLRVTADPRWLVRANADGKQVSPGRWEFAATAPIATYLITLAAGPYHEVTGEHDGIPLAVLARASLGAHLRREAPEILEITAACLDHFHRLFGVRYPFGAYRQVFAPEFSWGAMEFPGCVLIRDELMFQGAVTDTERERRAVLLAHEMAHMWFGNLVTMRWWDDLWLNESFADYLGWRVVVEATRWRTAWTTYRVRRKTWGYAADQRPSTHPVAATAVTDTAQALANFDGISYAKGSAVLRQLVAWVGDDAFLAGLRSYFDAHAYGNATLQDLLGALTEASGRDLAGWAQPWLREAQVNTLRPELAWADGRLARCQIRQSAPPDYPTLRPHRVSVGVYDEGADGQLRRRERVLVDLSPERDGEVTPVPELASTPAGALLLVDDEDLSYAKVRLPEATGEEVASLLSRLADPLARAVCWGSLWDACRDAELPANRLVTVATSAMPTETELPLFETMLEVTVDTVADRYLPPSQRPAAYAAVAAACRDVLAAAPPGSGWQLAAARGLIRCAGPEDQSWLGSWLAGGAPAGLPVDAELRWRILCRLAVLGVVDDEQITAEAARDRSARGRQEAIRARAARPDPAAKAAAWQLIVADRELSNRLVLAAADGFWRPEHATQTQPYVARYFAEINETAGWRSEQMLAAVTQAAFPSYAVDAETLAAAQARLATGDLHPIVRRELGDAADDLRRALAARTEVVASAG
ncbi:aminopeptidase N [Natronosporangium hydrolyticum]|uniref:Aminopeptidase N n=1 Tax=Natronosporangium hydrolyticum TaxID=2811111 RepID=A0A895YJ67_9ACTN|nr:aminopeptidase N [Natronosporangium hydrolyticum]QSB16082.1 aminopeptidase N [Natronosporangium hydrolyticum]